MELVIACLSALAILCLGFFGFSVLGRGQEEARRRTQARLAALVLAGPEVSAQDIVRHRVLSEVPWLNRFLAGLSWITGFEKVILQARAKGTPGMYLLAAAVIGASGLAVGIMLSGSILAGLLLGALLAPLPIIKVHRQRAKRMQAFGRQLPDALDLVSRALKAGSTFTGGMRMAADEFAEPLGPEFAATLDEINFGVDVDKALLALLDRVDCPDLQFFVVSVNIQRETGGNLAEIIANTASLIRERFKLLGRVRVVSAEGRLSALVLMAMPFVTALIIYFINPEYMSLLFTEPIGRMMAGSSLFMMLVGFLVMRRLVNFRI